MTSRLIQFEATDKLQLPGLLYEPATKTKRAGIWLHGMSASVFYSVDRSNIIGQALNKKYITYLAFNNRGSEMVKSLKIGGSDKQVKAGMSYELIKDCIKDIDGAIKFLQSLGYNEFYLMGHSTGANKICVYNFYKPKNVISKYVLLGGGDDTGLAYDVLGKKLFYALLKKAKAKVDKGLGEELSQEELYYDGSIFSYQSVYDIIDPEGDYNSFPFLEYNKKVKLSKKPLFEQYKAINKPTLVVYGENDPYCDGPEKAIATLNKHTTDPHKFSFKIVPEAEHDFDGYEAELAKTIADWL